MKGKKCCQYEEEHVTTEFLTISLKPLYLILK